MPSILSLPNELLSQIANLLTKPRCLYKLALSCRCLAAVAVPVIHKLAVQDKDDLTALQWAIYGCARNCDGHREWPGAPPRYHQFKGRGQSDKYLVRVLLAQAVDVNYRGEGYTNECARFQRCIPAIYLAVQFGALKILRILLEHGANPNLKSRSGRPLARAFSDGKWEAAIILLEHGADIRSVDFSSYIRLMPDALLALLIERGVDVKRKDDVALMSRQAVDVKRKDDVALMSQQAVDVNNNGGSRYQSWKRLFCC